MTISTSSNTQNKSFARRVYKKISKRKLKILNDFRSKIIPKDQIKLSNIESISLEIGFGNGEHLINQMYCNQHHLFLGCEVFLNGILHFLHCAQENQLNNFLLFTENVTTLIPSLPNDILYKIYILFPDPWPKSKQKKRRLVNEIFLKQLQSKLKKNAIIEFMSDNEDYSLDVYHIFKKSRVFKTKFSDNSSFFKNYLYTKYHQKASALGKKIFYVSSQYIN